MVPVGPVLQNPPDSIGGHQPANTAIQPHADAVNLKRNELGLDIQ